MLRSAQAVAVVLLLTGCVADEPAAEAAPPAGVGAEVVATQDVLPNERDEEFADFAINRRQYNAAWERFRLEGEPPKIDFSTSGLLFLGFGESGSCPATFDRLTVRGRVIGVDFGPRGDGLCTADYNPRTFVLAVPRQDMPRGGFTVELDGSRSFTLAGRSPTPPTAPSIVLLLTSEPVELTAIADPTAATRGDTLAIILRNDGDVAVSTGGWTMTLLTWDGRRWAGAADQPEFDEHPAIEWKPVTVRPGERRRIATVRTGDLELGWHSVQTKLQAGGRGGAVVIQRRPHRWRGQGYSGGCNGSPPPRGLRGRKPTVTT